jgi:hypothetical protein
VEVKTKKLKKLWGRYQATERDARDLQEEFAVRVCAMAYMAYGIWHPCTPVCHSPVPCTPILMYSYTPILLYSYTFVLMYSYVLS